jgi:hypothetical protein
MKRSCSPGLFAALAWAASAAPPVTLQDGPWKVTLDPSTLATSASRHDGRHVTLSRAAITAGEPAGLRVSAASAQWRLAKLDIGASLSAEGFRITFHNAEPGFVTWPVLGEEPGLEACVLPRGEGLYVPVRETRWRNFLLDQSPIDTMEHLSMPVWGLRYPGLTVAYIMENPFDNQLVWVQHGSELWSNLTHRFERNQPGAQHSMLVRFGGDSPVETALLFRQWFSTHYRFTSYQEKIRALPDAEKLLGAAHLYLWGLNSAAGGPVTLIRRLHSAGFDRLWLGADAAEVDYLRAHPEPVKLAREYGYLFAPYDSYHSIHSPSEKDTWGTAQFDQSLYDSGGIVNEDGSKSRGFKGKGLHLSSLAAKPYVARRVDGILQDAPFNSWFVDCDATGELFDNYSSDFPQTKQQDMMARLERLSWIRDRKQMVVGSEEGAWYAAPAIHFAHGMMTPLFGWKDPVLRDAKSKYFLGRYYPPDAPAVFFRTVELPQKYLALYFDPRYRLPLFQVAFHDAVITTNHWSQPSRKFANAIVTRELLELLYGVPPLYHLNPAQFDSIVPAIKTHYAFFSPLHREIGGLPMTSFEWMTPDRQLQRAVFGGRMEVIANFGDSAAQSGPDRIPARSVLVRRPGAVNASIYTPTIAGPK